MEMILFVLEVALNYFSIQPKSSVDGGIIENRFGRPCVLWCLSVTVDMRFTTDEIVDDQWLLISVRWSLWGRGYGISISCET